MSYVYSVIYFSLAVTPPSEPSLVTKTSFSLTIEWKLEDELHEKMVEFYEISSLSHNSMIINTLKPRSLQFQDEHKDHLKWIVINPKCKKNQFVVSNLKSLSFYSFKVRAYIKNHGWCAFSSVSQPFQTNRRM